MKNASISVSRVAATILIVICHIVKYYTFIPGSSLLGQVFNVGVPMFVIISGYLYGEKRDSKWTKEKVKTFMFDRWMRVSFPCQIWAVILFICTLSYLPHTIITLLNLQGGGWIVSCDYLIGGSPYISHTWFVTVILLCYAMIPLLSSHVEKLNFAALALMVILAQPLNYLGVHINILLLFVISYVIAYRNCNLDKIRGWMLLLTAALCMGIRIAGRLLFDDTIFYNDIISSITHYGLAAAIILLIRMAVKRFSSAEKMIQTAPFAFIEKHSYSIYIVHYCLIPAVYENLSLGVATIVFFAGTIIFALGLDFITLLCNKGIKKLIDGGCG